MNKFKYSITIHQLITASSPTPSNRPSSKSKMAILLDLSNELLLQILDSVTPLAIVSFATSCKRINALAQDNLALHRQRIEKYQDVTLWGCPRHQDRPHPILLLQDVCNDWRVAYYARSLVIRCCGTDPYMWNHSWNPVIRRSLIARDVELIKSVFPEIIIPVTKILSKAFRWDEAKINDVFRQTLGGVRGAILGLFIVLLPAIRSISFDGYRCSDSLWFDWLQSITDQQDSHSGSSEATFLMGVSELNFLDQGGSPAFGKPCSIVPFMAVPSLGVTQGFQSVFRHSMTLGLLTVIDFPTRPS